jgi:hypothetical protein
MPAKTKKAKVLPEKNRVRKLDKKYMKKAVRQKNKLPGSLRLFGQSLKHLWLHRRLFIKILLIYSLLHFIFVKGLAANFQLNDTKVELQEVLGDDIGKLATASILFGALIGTSSSSAGDAANVFQVFLFVVISLAVIWTLRSTYETSNNLKFGDIFYQSTYPLIPYILVSLVFIFQLIPALIGISLYSTVMSNGIAVGAFEQIVWLLVFVLGISLSLYFVCSSLLASYIVTLPNMTPLKALRSSKKIIKYRRWSVIRRIFFLPVAIIVILVGIFFPLVLFMPILAEVLFVFVSLCFVIIGHSYFYNLYRQLL